MDENFAVAYFVFLLLAGIYRINRLIRSYQRPVGCRGKIYTPGSYALLLSIYVGIAVASIMEYFIVRSAAHIDLWVSFVGAAMYIAVIPVREKAIKLLGDNMSPEVEIKKEHQLIKDGPYRYLRHPLSLCVIIELIGFTLVSNSYYAFGGALLVFSPFMLVRIYMEEQALLEKFGDEYLQYKKEVYALFPIRKTKTQ